jgi:hypothetical protein
MTPRSRGSFGHVRGQTPDMSVLAIVAVNRTTRLRIGEVG